MSKEAQGRKLGLVGRKCGMTRIFTPEGISIPVTVVEILPNRITQIKSFENDGYEAIQITTGEQKVSRLNKAQLGHFAKAETQPGRGLWEFRIEGLVQDPMPVGTELTVELFNADEMVDVQGVIKGRGFTGTIVRWNFKAQRNSHGNSRSHRVPGSIGQNQTPGRVFKGKKMCGQWGNETRTIQNLKVIRVDRTRNILLIKGAVPGAPGGTVIVRPAVKTRVRSETSAA